MATLMDDLFSTTRTIPGVSVDLTPVGEDVMRYFATQEYTVSGSRLASGGWHISIYKGDWFRMILGLKTALNISIEPLSTGIFVKAEIGIFELQALPTVIALFVFHPIILGQIWGFIQQQALDDEAVKIVEDRIAYYAGVGPVAPATDAARAEAESELGPMNI